MLFFNLALLSATVFASVSASGSSYREGPASLKRAQLVSLEGTTPIAFMGLTNGTTYDFDDHLGYSVLAETEGGLNSVEFYVGNSSQISREEFAAPYYLAGDNGGAVWSSGYLSTCGPKTIRTVGKAGSGAVLFDQSFNFELSCGAPEPEPEPFTVYDIIVEDPKFSTLETAINTIPGLVSALQGPGPFTVFAPTNEAFAALPPGTLSSLLSDPAELEDLLKSHVVAGTYDEALLESPAIASLIPLSGAGDIISITVSNGVVVVNDATIIDPDNFADNGVVHGVDKVLCNNNGFTCPTGTIPTKFCPKSSADCACNNGGFQCPPSFTPINSCPTSDADCACNNGGFQCPPGFIPTSSCPTSDADCACNNGGFQCPPGFIPTSSCPTSDADCACNNGGFQCPLGLAPTSSCPTSNADCACNNGGFQCPPGFIPTNSCPFGLADCQCNSSFQCPPNSVATSTCPQSVNDCECSDNFFLVNGSCSSCWVPSCQWSSYWDGSACVKLPFKNPESVVSPWVPVSNPDTPFLGCNAMGGYLVAGRPGNIANTALTCECHKYASKNVCTNQCAFRYNRNLRGGDEE